MDVPSSDDDEDTAASASCWVSNYCFLVTTTSLDTQNGWGIESCCSHHVTSHPDLLNNKHLGPPPVIKVADDTSYPARMIGDIALNVALPGPSADTPVQTATITIHDIYYVPGIRHNLLSVNQLSEERLRRRLQRQSMHGQRR